MALSSANSGGPKWLSANDAAAVLGVSPKTVWRRAKSGELTARKVASERGGEVWEIALETPTDRPDKPTGQNRPTDRTQTAPKVIDEREPTGQTERTPTDRPAKPTGQNADTDAATGARFMAHLETENKFLRAALEQRDRDAAELRAALRTALKLTAGTSAPQLGAANPENAGNGGGVAASGAAVDREKSSEPTGNKSGAALTYADIADELERRLRGGA